MQDWTSIFSGTPESARELATLLEDRGLDCYIDDRVGPVVTPNGGREHFSRVLVPPDIAERAHVVSQAWSSQNAQDVRALSRRLARILVLSLVLPTAWALSYIARPDLLPVPEVRWLAVVWAVGLVVIAQVEHRRHESERISLPAA